MSKTITSPVKEFPGTIKLPARLTMPQALAFEQSIAEAQALMESENVSQTKYDAIMLDAICQIVEEWSLDDLGQLAPDTFPATPRKASAELVSWIYGEIAGLYSPEVPNE
jgi:hypothetical protein